jgi:S1-C subfamily serine protease
VTHRKMLLLVLTPAIAKAFGQKEVGGAFVGDVSANSPAQKSSIEKGDTILDVNGKPVADSNELRMTISMVQPVPTSTSGCSERFAARRRCAIGRIADHYSVG